MQNLTNSKHPYHWHHVYKRKRQRANNISTLQIVVGQTIALSGSLLAGYILELNKEAIVVFAGAFLLLPGVVDLAASITGAMCAKINHLLEAKKKLRTVLLSSILFAFLLSVTSGLIVGIVGGTIGSLIFGSSFVQVCKLALITMIAVGLISYPCMSLLTLLIKKLGFDPDNIIGPVETGFTDAFTALTVAVLVRILI